MTFEADQVIDRRNLQRRLSFWRALGIVALALAITVGYFLFLGRDFFPWFAPADQIARVSITGYIAQDRQLDELLEKLSKTEQVKAVIVSIDSTGGATTGGEALYEGLRKLAKQKPTVATVGNAGTSAAYIVAIATDHIVARRTSITGSIGVMFQWPEIGELIDILGIKVEEIKSSPLKGDPSRFKPTSPEARAVLFGVLNDSYDWFVDIFAERRGLSRNDALELADGRIFTGRQALSSGLIDQIGGEEEAIDWLVAERNIQTDLPVKDWKSTRPGSGLSRYFDALVARFAQEIGFSPALLRTGGLESLEP